MTNNQVTRRQVAPTPPALALDLDVVEAINRTRLTRRGLSAALAGVIIGLADLGPDALDRRARR